jgi:flavorubredoxin
MSLENFISHSNIDNSTPTELFADGDHAIYWLGFSEETVFRCNTYLIKDGDEAIIVDPGGVGRKQEVQRRIEQLMPVDTVKALVISHQDPDIAGSMKEWLDYNPAIQIITSPRTVVLLPHYGIADFTCIDIEERPLYEFASGRELQFLPAPFLHSPMAYVTFDRASGFMFTGDIFAAVDAEWGLVIDDFARHSEKMDLFHMDYMASNAAAAGFVETIEDLPIKAFLPQHGSIIAENHVASALDYLRNLQCGLDITYPHL